MALEEVSDPRNIGSIIRSAASFNIDGLIVKERSFPYESKLLYKSASGCMEHIKIFYTSNISTTLKYLKDLKLVDYKVRILNTGTNAITRVSIESTDREGKSWFTIGVSPNIIEASFKALIDSLDYKLYKEKAPANN